MAVLVPPSFKQPINLEAYDGFTNLQEHFEAFKATMMLSGTPNAIMCHAFSTTLKKASLQWFMGLPRNYISCFRQLTDQFLTHFATSKAYKKTSASLINIK